MKGIQVLALCSACGEAILMVVPEHLPRARVHCPRCRVVSEHNVRNIAVLRLDRLAAMPLEELTANLSRARNDSTVFIIELHPSRRPGVSIDATTHATINSRVFTPRQIYDALIKTLEATLLQLRGQLAALGAPPPPKDETH